MNWATSLTLYQLLTPAFATLMVFSLCSRKMRRNISTGSFLLGILIWVGAAFVALFPDFSLHTLTLLGIREGIRALIFFGMLVMAFTIYTLILHTDKIDRELTLLARDIALKELDRERIEVPVGNVAKKSCSGKCAQGGCGDPNCGCKVKITGGDGE